jgi:hypothetical protein
MRITASALILFAVFPSSAAERVPTVEYVFGSAQGFVEHCAPLIEMSILTEDEQTGLAACSAFAAGVTQALLVADEYRTEGIRVCARSATARVVIDRAARLYEKNAERGVSLSAAQLIVASFVASTPCEP